MKHLAIVCFIMLIAWSSKASHIIGGEITYKCLGGGNFEVTLDVFRDCFYGQAGFDDPAAVGVFNEDGLIETLELSPIFIDSLPTDLNDPCLEVPPDVCVDWARYQATVFLDPDLIGSAGFTIAYQRCCRNQTITNIVNPSETGATYFVEISPDNYNSCNSSPTFQKDPTTFTYPPVFVCVGKPIVYDHSAVDTNSDSLAYKFCTPYIGASFGFSQPPVPEAPPYDTLVWAANYSTQNLLGGPFPLKIDPITGLITGLPTISGQFVVGVCVEEYRDGELIGTVRRDFQYNVGMCLELIADFDSPDAQCDNLTVQFENTSSLGENFVWYPQWPQMDIVSTSENLIHTYPDTGTFTVCLINEPFSICSDTLCKEIFLQYNSTTADFDFSTFDCADSSVVVLQDLSTDTISPVVEWNWEIDYSGTIQTSTEQHPTFIVPNPSAGTITLMVRTENGCERTKVGTYQTNQNNPTSQIPSFVQICKGDSVGLNPNMIGGSAFTFDWGLPINSNEQNPIVSPDSTITYPVTISAFNGLCSTEYEITVQVLELPILDFEFTSDCDGVTLSFNNTSQNSFAFVWDFGDGSPTSNSYFPTHAYPDTGTYVVTLATASVNLCQDTLVREITIEDKILVADFDISFVSCETAETTIQFENQSINSLDNTNFYNWNFESLGGSIEENPTLTITEEQTIVTTLTILTMENCSSVKTDTIEIDFIEYDFPDSVKVCWNESIELNPNGDPNYEYLWTPEIYLDDPTKPNPTVSPEETTTYTVRIRNFSADTCEITREVMVYVPPRLNVNAGEDILTCDENTTLTATSDLQNVSYEWENADNDIIGNEASVEVYVSGVNNYFVTATDEFNCQETDFASVGGGPIDIELAGEQIKCTDEPVNIFLNNLDDNDELTIVWSPTEAFQTDPTNETNPQLEIQPGEQMIYVDVESQFGCTLQDSIFVALVDTEIELDFDFQVACSGSTVDFTNLSNDAFSYVWHFGTGDSSLLDNPSYTYTEIGVYNVTLDIIYDVHCVETTSMDVEILSPDFMPNFDYEYNSCSTEEIIIQFSDNSFNFLNNTNSWNWTFSNGETATGLNPIITVTENQTLTACLEIGTPNGCTGTICKDLEIELIEEDLEDGLTLCSGDSLQLNPTGNQTYIYNWNPSTGISNPNEANPTVYTLETTNYGVTITNISADTCSIERDILVTVPETFEVTAVGDTTTCGTENTLIANSTLDPAINFEWMTMDGQILQTGSSITVNPAEEITLILEGTDESMCFDRDTVTVSNEAIELDVTFKGEGCPNDTIQVLATNGIPQHNLDIIWEAVAPAQILGDNTGLAITIVTAPANQNAHFVLTSTNQFGCTRMDTVTIFSHPFFPIFESEVMACPFVETAINPNGTLAQTYSWHPPNLVSDPYSPNPTVTLEETTNFSVVISETFGNDVCEFTANVFVEVPTIIDIQETPDTFTCGTAILICAEVNVPGTMLWTTSQGVTIEGEDCIGVDPEESDYYIVTVEDEFECMTSDTVFVSNEAVNLSVIGDGELSTCPKNSMMISVTNLDPDDDLTYEWTAISNGEIIDNGNTNEPTISTIPNTFATFEVVATNQFGCEITEQVVVQTYEFEAATEDTVRVCENVPTELNPNFSNGLTYEWSPTQFLDNPNSPNPTATLTENTLFSVTITGYNELDTCTITKEVLAMVNPSINLTTDPTEQALCEFMEMTLSANTDTQVDFEWSDTPDYSNIIGTENNVQVNPMGMSIYHVRATDDLGCQKEATIIINAFPIDISLDDIHNFCVENGTVPVEIINNDPNQSLTIQWSPAEIIEVGNENSNPIEVAVENNTWLFANVQNQFGCEISDSTLIQYFNLNTQFGEITAEPDTIILGSGVGSQLNIDDVENVFYEWIPNDGLDFSNIPNPIATPEETTTYTVELFNEEGCLTSREIEVVVKDLNCTDPFVFIPSAFSPNGDGENDMLFIRGIHLDEVELMIFNRWGQKVFQTTDPTIGWNGTFKGEFLAPDVYGYFLKVKCFNGEEFFKKGNISLLR